jgi:hypothetical protein
LSYNSLPVCFEITAKIVRNYLLTSALPDIAAQLL